MSVGQVSPLQSYFPLVFTVFLKSKSLCVCSPHLRGGYLFFSSLSWGYLHILFEVLLHGKRILHLFIYSVIYLHPYTFNDTYFMLWVIIQYYVILALKLFQLWPLGILSLGFCVPLTYPTIRHACVTFFVLFCISFSHDPIRCSKPMLYIPCPSLRIIHFSKVPWFLLFKIAIRNQDLNTMRAQCYWSVVTYRPSQMTKQWNTCVYSNLHMYT